MKLTYEAFKKIIVDKFKQEGGNSYYRMLNGNLMRLWLSEDCDGVMNDRFKKLNCEFRILYAIYEQAIYLGGKMELGATPATAGKRIGDSDFSVDTIDAFVAIEFYHRKVGDTTTRRSTYFAAVLDWAGIAKNYRGGFLIVNPIYR